MNSTHELMIQPSGMAAIWPEDEDAWAAYPTPLATTYSFWLNENFYNSLPFELKRFLCRSGNPLYSNTRHPVEITLYKDEFIQFNLLLFEQVGHS